MKAKGRFAFTTTYIKTLLGIPEEVQICKVSYDEAFGVITLIGYSPEAIEGQTWSFKEADRMPDITYEEDLYNGKES